MSDPIYFYKPQVQTTNTNAGPLRSSYPFADDGDLKSVVVSEPLMIYSKAYIPLANGTSAPSHISSFVSGSGTMYYLDDSDFQEESNLSTIYFRRNYGNIPQSRSISIGTTAYSYPALTQTSGSSINLTSGNGATYTAASAHGLAVGDLIQMFTQVEVGTTGWQIIDNEIRMVQSVPSSTSFIVKTDVGGLRFISGSFFKVGKRTEARSLIAPAIWDYYYYAPNTDPSTISIEPTFEILDANGNVTTTLTNDTVPTSTQYLSMVSSGSYLVYETEISRYRGGMLQKIVKKVRAL